VVLEHFKLSKHDPGGTEDNDEQHHVKSYNRAYQVLRRRTPYFRFTASYNLIRITDASEEPAVPIFRVKEWMTEYEVTCFSETYIYQATRRHERTILPPYIITSRKILQHNEQENIPLLHINGTATAIL
jgi:hypothetical protein